MIRAAGGISAITAHDAGAQVLLIEKMPHPGGISILSGGGVAFAHNAEGAFQYLKRTCNGTTPDDILRKMAATSKEGFAKNSNPMAVSESCKALLTSLQADPDCK